MNLDNVVLVRVMNNLPLNGELIPSSEAPCLVDDHSSDYHYFIYEAVKKDLEQKLGRPLTYEECDGNESLLGQKVQEYIVKKSKDYTSTLSFSLNGMVPDDTNCKFQKMPMAVIDPIKFHTDADFVNVVVTDTTIKGRMKVSPSAILVIDADYFQSLSEEEKINLYTNFKLEFFRGDLKKAIDETLIKNNYPALSLRQGHHDQKIEECPEKESMLEFLEAFAASVGASTLSLTDLYQPIYSDPTDKKASDKVNDYVEKTNIIDEYSKKTLYEFLVAKSETLGVFVSDEEKFYLFSQYERESIDAMEKITARLIEAYGGLENYKAFSKEFNEYFKNNIISAEEIISMGESRK